MRKLIAALCLSVCGFTAQAEVQDIDNAELARLIAAGVPVIDIRTAAEWKQTGIVPGSHPLTFFDDQGRADPAAWLEKAQSIARLRQPVVLICRSGNRTKAVSDFLSRNVGYAKVYNVKEGIRAWAKAGRPLVPAELVLAGCQAAKTC
jgi:rhodanese-related sulfurtransferase